MYLRQHLFYTPHLKKITLYFNSNQLLFNPNICSYYPGVDSKTGKANTSLNLMNYNNFQSQTCKHNLKNNIRKTSSYLEDVETSCFDEDTKCSSLMKDTLSTKPYTPTFQQGMNPYYVFNNNDMNNCRLTYSNNVLSNSSYAYNVNSPMMQNIIINNSNSDSDNHTPLINSTTLKKLNIYYGNYSDETLGELSVYLVKEQHGCRFIQDKVKKDSFFANNYLFPNLLKEICEIICDPFGNYLFQILFDVLTPQNLSIVISSIKNDMNKICSSSYGTRVIQKLIEIIEKNDELLNQFNGLLTNQLIISIAQNVHGNHIIKKYISDVPYPKNQVIFDAIQFNFISIANTKHGCCIIQKCLKEANAIQRESLIALIQKNLFSIISDQYGNYIFQYLISFESQQTKLDTVKLILPKLISISKHKYSSNAIEKCFENADECIQTMILNQILEKEVSIDDLLLDPFGNYIIQKALVIAKDANYKKLLVGISRNIDKLRGVSFGVKLISKLINNHPELGHILSNEYKGFVTMKRNSKGMRHQASSSSSLSPSS